MVAAALGRPTVGRPAEGTSGTGGTRLPTGDLSSAGQGGADAGVG